MNNILYPTPLIQGSKIAITAFSSGVPEPLHQRLDCVIQSLRDSGFEVIEGRCLRDNRKHVSASPEQRAQELMTFLCDDSIAAVIPPWGGEFAMDILPLLDYERLKTAKPKWIIGYSDISTVSTALTMKLGWCTVHSANLMELHPEETDQLTSNTLQWLTLREGEPFTQHSSSHHQLQGHSYAKKRLFLKLSGWFSII